MANSNLTNLELYEDPDTERMRNETEITIASCFLIVIMVIAVCGNIAVIIVMTTHKSLRKEASNVLIINLSITDLSSTVFVMLSALISLTMNRWPFGQLWCDYVCAINYCLFIVSALTLCCISVDRYQFILHPLTYNSRVTRKRLLFVILYTWLQGAAFGMTPSLLKWVHYDYWEAICAIQWHLNRPPSLIYVIVAFLACFLGPGIVLVYCYVTIVKTAKKYQARIKTTSYSVSDVRLEKGTSMTDQTRIVWSLIVVVVAFFMCTAPFSVTKLIKVSAGDSGVVPGYVNLVSALLGYVASAINPLIYGIFRKDIRRSYKDLFMSIIYRRKFQHSTDTSS